MIEGERLTLLRKRCTGTCDTVKPWVDFYVRRRWEDGTVRDVQAWCKECSKAYKRQWDDEHREHVNRNANRRYHEGNQDPERLALRRERQRTYARRRNNVPPERYRTTGCNGNKPPETHPFGAVKGELTWQTARWADGAKVLAWLKTSDLLPEQFGPDMDTVAKAVYRWSKGYTARADSVDNVLSRLGAHVSELPDDVWLRSGTQGVKRDSDDA